MSRRPGILVSLRRDAPAGKSPNAYYPELSAEVRCHWTPLTPLSDVLEILRDAFAQAVDDVQRKHPDRPDV